MKILKIKDNVLEFNNGIILRTITNDKQALIDFSYLETYHFNINSKKEIRILDVVFPEDIENYITIIKDKGISIKDINQNSYFIPCYITTEESQLALGIYNKLTFKDKNSMFIIPITDGTELVRNGF